MGCIHALKKICMFHFRVAALGFFPKDLTEGSNEGLFSFEGLFTFRIFSNVNLIQFL